MKMLVKWKSVWTFSLVNIHLTMSFGSNKAMIYLLVVTKCRNLWSWTYWCSVRFKRKRLLKYAVKTYNSSFVVVLLKLDKENVLMLLSDLWCGYLERVAAHQSSTLQFDSIVCTEFNEEASVRNVKCNNSLALQLITAPHAQRHTPTLNHKCKNALHHS